MGSRSNKNLFIDAKLKIIRKHAIVVYQMPGINITPHMQYNEDKRIKINVPFLQDRIVLYIDSSIGTIK